MAVIELSVTRDYVPNWGVWEGLRELMQNALDEADREHTLTVSHNDDPEKGPIGLTMFNEGSNMTIKACLLGEGDKADDCNTRGEHCEGLAMAFLALVRAEVEVTITTMTEVWKAGFEHSEKYEEEVLVVRTRKHRKDFRGVSVFVGIDAKVWDQTRERFLAYCDPIPEDQKFTDATFGTLIVVPEMAGKVFSRGIFIQHRKDFKYAYDLHELRLDRDRQTVVDFDLKWAIAQLVTRLTGKECGDLSVEIPYRLLREGRSETEFLTNVGTRGFGPAIVEEFLKEEGPDAVPITDATEAEEARRHGRFPVMVSYKFKNALEHHGVQSLGTSKMNSEAEIVKIYMLEELSVGERESFRYAETTVVSAFWGLREMSNSQFFGKDTFEEDLKEGLDIHPTWLEVDPESITFQVVDFAAGNKSFHLEEGVDVIYIARAYLKGRVKALRHVIRALAKRHSSKERPQSLTEDTEDIWIIINQAKFLNLYRNSGH